MSVCYDGWTMTVRGLRCVTCYVRGYEPVGSVGTSSIHLRASAEQPLIMNIDLVQLSEQHMHLRHSL